MAVSAVVALRRVSVRQNRPNIQSNITINSIDKRTECLASGRELQPLDGERSVALRRGWRGPWRWVVGRPRLHNHSCGEGGGGVGGRRDAPLLGLREVPRRRRRGDHARQGCFSRGIRRRPTRRSSAVSSSETVAAPTITNDPSRTVPGNPVAVGIACVLTCRSDPTVGIVDSTTGRHRPPAALASPQVGSRPSRCRCYR